MFQSGATAHFKALGWKNREGQFGQCGMRRDWEDEAGDAAGPGRPFNDLGHKTMRSHGM